MKRKMKEKDAIVIAGILGIVVLLLLFKVWFPLVWGNDGDETQTVQNVTEAGISAAGIRADAVSSAAAGISDIDGNDTEVLSSEMASASGTSIETRIAVPSGYTRTVEKSDSFASFVRSYPLKKDGSKVKLYNGNLKENQDAHIAVFKLPIENEDLQQCADSVIRMYAEYFWQTKQYERISFRFADGFQAEYVKWQEGFRIQPGTTSTTWVDSGADYDASYENFKKYIRMVFAYSSTISMEQESKKTTLRRLQIGDIFIQSGSPGHVVMVADICENEEGKKAFLLAQGYMPAQQFHLLKNPAHESDPWYYEDEVTYPFETPEYTFEKGSLRHLNY